MSLTLAVFSGLQFHLLNRSQHIVYSGSQLQQCCGIPFPQHCPVLSSSFNPRPRGPAQALKQLKSCLCPPEPPVRLCQWNKFSVTQFILPGRQMGGKGTFEVGHCKDYVTSLTEWIFTSEPTTRVF